MNTRLLGKSLILSLAAALFAVGCGGGGGGSISQLPLPIVTSTFPANGALAVPTGYANPGTSIITATFNRPMLASSITTSSFYASEPSMALPGVVTYANKVATLRLNSPLPENTIITATITTSVMDTGAPSRPGEQGPLKTNYVWTFKTGYNDASPTVVSTVPVNLAVGVSPSSSVTATFSKAMNAATINGTTFTLSGPSSPGKRTTSLVPATVTYVNDIATLSPTAPLTASTVYTATVSTGATDVAGSPLLSNTTWSFTTATADIPPTVISTVPAASATGVSISSKVMATFSEAMNPATITGNTFTLTPAGGSAIAATVSYANDTATLDPTAPLKGSTVYTAQVNTGVTDVAGSALAANKTWTFTTSSTDVAPTVISTIPAATATGVSISSNVTATFSESMNAASITTTTFTLAGPGGTAVPAAVTYANDAAVLNPTAALAGNTVYTATVTTGVQDIAGTPMAANKVWTFTTATSDVAPTVISTIPAALATGVSINTTVSATFSESMSASTITGTTFTLAGPGGTALNATVTYANGVAVLTPSAALAAGTVYTATVTTGAQDVAGTGLAANKVWTFTTESAPTIVSTIPANLATGVAVNSTVSATFSEALTANTVNGTTFILTGPNGLAVPATVSYLNDVATLAPTSALAGNAVYKVTINTGVKNVDGIPLAATKTWTFTTIANGAVPTVTSTNPANKATGVFLNQAISATFSEPMLASSLNTTSFTVNGVTGTVTYFPSSQIASFVPSNNLSPNTTYTANIQTWAQDAKGNDLTNTYTWTFTTGTMLAQGPVNLGSASTYGVLAGSTVTNGGPTIVNGNLGVSPGTAVVGFPPGTVTGTIHAGDAVAAQAKADLLQGQLDAAGRLGANALPGDLSGLTIYPGLYNNSTSVMVSSGNVTFDAQGDPDAVFILQMGSTLTTGSGTGMVLAGGAQASNIYWSVGTSATLGVNSNFVGVILSQASITANTGCTVTGVLLTNVGAVTMQSNTITPNLRKRSGAITKKKN